MPYPNLKNKHLREAIIRPDHTGAGRTLHFGKIPRRCILFYQPSPFSYLKKRLKGNYRKLNVSFDWGFKGLYYTSDIIFGMIGGIGAPHATLMFEELIALGTSEFVSIGIAGGLNNFGLFLCDKAVRDEGTSLHYAQHEMFAYPNALLTKRLEKILERDSVPYTRAATWTTDAPLRETKAEVEFYRKKGVATVEMELSSLFVVAKLRKVKIAALLMVSDVLGDDWKDMNNSSFVRKGLQDATRCAVECLK